MRDVVIVEAGRSPIGKKKGALSSAHPTELLAQVMAEVLKRAKVEPAAVGQAIGGCINKVGAQAFNVIRTAWLTAGALARRRLLDGRFAVRLQPVRRESGG